uniref:Uncharacterized protein n=1 Tax=Vespula pensylvanica TaxID=30213 RepID=A0A834N3I3_VESPE|nr:hypothetical protein H0235_017070 [Vespula pensylvanica]
MGFYIVTVVMFLTTIALVKVNFNDLGVLALCSLVVIFQHKFLIEKLSKIYRMVKNWKNSETKPLYSSRLKSHISNAKDLEKALKEEWAKLRLKIKSSARSKEMNNDVILEAINKNSFLTTRMLAMNNECSHMAVEKILHAAVFGMKLDKQIPHDLTRSQQADYAG